MKHLSYFLVFFLILTLQAFSQEDLSLKVIIKDHGDKTREEVDHSKLCKQVMTDQQRLLTSIRPEFVQKVILKESTTLEVFRADDTVGYAAKCTLKFPIK